MTYAIRPFAADFAAITPLVNLLNPESVSPERLEALHAQFPAAGLRNRLVAVNEAGQVVGYANTAHYPGAKPGQFYVTLVTAPVVRRQGVGSALLEDLAGWTRANGGTRLFTGIPDNDEAALRFAQRHGFAVEGHQFESVLDVPGFDESTYAGVVDRICCSGIRFFTYADQPGEVLQRQIYELYKVTDLDTPGYAGTDPALYPPFERWQEEIFGNEDTLPDGLIIAAEGDRLVGMTLLQRDPDQNLYTDYTGVLQECRGRQLGLALKLLSVRYARAFGAKTMRTKNDARNGPMLAINTKMGYVKTGGRYWIARAL